MIVMEHPEGGNEDTTQKRKRRPKSYQGCTQCRLARRKCGEGMSCIIQHETPIQESRQMSTYPGIVMTAIELMICFVNDADGCRETGLCLLRQEWKTM
jgi:hypothetical protein